MNEPLHGGTEYIVLIGLFALIGLLFVGFRAWVEYRRDRERHLTLRSLVEKGTPIPEALLVPASGGRGAGIRRGITLLFVGGALTVTLLDVAGAPGVWGVGLMVAAAGVAQFLGTLLTERK
jgi:hypothetical protein